MGETFIGVIVDSKLNWKSDISLTKEKLINAMQLCLKQVYF